MKYYSFAWLVFLVGCGTASDDNCEPGRQLECFCSGGVEGFQSCLPDGSGWGECSCSNSDCPSNQTKCGTDCTNTRYDPDNCGSCYNDCQPDEACIYGECREISGGSCPSGQVMCGNKCVDWLTDDDNCGQCDNACGLHADCVNGQCSCVAGYSDCLGQCVNLNFDLANCGTCGNVCGVAECCCNGMCG